MRAPGYAGSLLPLLVLAACGGEAVDDPATSEGASAESQPPMSIRISEPSDGAVVEGDSVRFSLTAEDVEIVPAGTDGPRTGHHHLLFNVDAPAGGQPIPSTDGYVHLGQAQTGYVAGLEPGEYRVIALLGDFAHIPHDPPVADTIHITVGGG